MSGDRDSEDKNRDKKPSNMPQDRDWESETNPFVAFRRFADEQVSAVLQSITGLPSALAPPQPDHWTIFTDDKTYNDMKYRQRDGTGTINTGGQNYTTDEGAGSSSSSGSHDDNDKPSDNDGFIPVKKFSQSSQSPKEMDSNSSPSHRRWSAEPSDPLSLDALSFPLFSQPFSMHFTSPMPSFFTQVNDDWPLGYIMYSPYSPLHLEYDTRSRARQHDGVFSSLMSSFRDETDYEPNEPQWREAFEDLLRVENGLPLLDREGSIERRTAKDWDWIRGIVKRGSLGKGYEVVGESDKFGMFAIRRTGPKSDGADDELALYERFLQHLEAREREFTEMFDRSHILRSLMEDRHNRRHAEDLGRPDSRPELPRHLEDRQGNDDNESWLDLVSGGNRKSVPETPAESDFTENKSSSRIVSTMSRTERTRLPNGSIETKKVVTKRYADGREETDSSVETTLPHSEPEETTKPEAGEPKPKNGNGWFWKE